MEDGVTTVNTGPTHKRMDLGAQVCLRVLASALVLV